jgi:GTP-binding protein
VAWSEKNNIKYIHCLFFYVLKNPGNCDWLEDYRIPYLYILTKTDKLSNNQTIARQRAIEKNLHITAEKKPILFSAITQKGKSDIWQFLADHLSSLPA